MPVLGRVVAEYFQFERAGGIDVDAPQILYPVIGEGVIHPRQSAPHHFRGANVELFGQVVGTTGAKNEGGLRAAQAVEFRLFVEVLERDRADVLRRHEFEV